MWWLNGKQGRLPPITYLLLQKTTLSYVLYMMMITIYYNRRDIHDSDQYQGAKKANLSGKIV